MTPATFRQRAIARCIDTVVLFLLTAGALAGFVEENDAGENVVQPPVWWILVLVVAVLTYEVVPVHARGQTPGKILTRIRVVRVDDPTTTPSWASAWFRWIGPAVLLAGSSVLGSAGPVVLPVLAVLYGSALLDRGGRSWIDKLAGTRVVQAS